MRSNGAAKRAQARKRNTREDGQGAPAADEADTAPPARSSSTSAGKASSARHLARRVRITPMSLGRVIVHTSSAKGSAALNANVDMRITKLLSTSMTDLARERPAHRTNTAHPLHQRRQFRNQLAAVR